MKKSSGLFSFCLFSLFFGVLIAEEVEIPTEVSEPPYKIGDLVMEQGYYIDQDEGMPRINLRFEENKMRVYWIDENGLIAKPEYTQARAHLRGRVRGKESQFLALLPGGEGLGAKGLLITPHLYNVILVLWNDDESDETVTHTFRYTPALDTAVDPLVDGGAASADAEE